MKRIEGFYWCLINGRWIVAQWRIGYEDDLGQSGDWLLSGIEEMYADTDFTEINESRILPPQ